MGVLYREYLKKQAKKRKVRTTAAFLSWSEAKERSTIRAEYFRKSPVGRHQASKAQRRLIDAW